MEQWDLYDKYRHYLNKSKNRGDYFEQNEYHIVVHVCIFDSKNRMLIQKRTDDKIGWPGLWDITVGGSCVHNEDSEQCARRELFEELGIDADFSEQRPYLTIHFKYGFDDFYILHMNVDTSKLVLQKDEVADAKWADKDEIINLLNSDKFIPYHNSLIDLLFDMSKTRGAHKTEIMQKRNSGDENG